MQVGVATSTAPTTFTYFPQAPAGLNGSNETTINLSAHAVQCCRACAQVRFQGTTVNSYEIRIGKIIIYDSDEATPKPPENTQELNVVSWNGSVTAASEVGIMSPETTTPTISTGPSP